MSVLWIVLLAAAGCILVFMEVLLPGGIIGVLGGLCIVTAVVMAFMRSQTAGMVTLVGCLVGTPTAIFVGLWAMPKIGLARKLWDYPILNDTSTMKNAPKQTGNTAKQSEARASLVGKTGTTVTNLRPGGLVEIDGNRLDVVARGGAIDKGTPVQVVDVGSNRIVVDTVDDA